MLSTCIDTIDVSATSTSHQKRTPTILALGGINRCGNRSALVSLNVSFEDTTILNLSNIPDILFMDLILEGTKEEREGSAIN